MTELCKIMAKHGSDKSPLWKGKRKPHDYTVLYDELFSKWRSGPTNILEVGIYKGASLCGWSEYFAKGAVIGVDILPPWEGTFGRAVTYKVDQTDPRQIREFFYPWWGNSSFDVIIDDGLHKPVGAVTFFELAFWHLREGGFYIVEDVKPKYLDETVRGMKAAHPEANIEVHDRRYPGSKYDNILIVVRKEAA